MDDREERIRHRAHALWQEAGEPEGRQDEFWYQAEQELLREEAAPSGELDPGIAVSPKATEKVTKGEPMPEERKLAAEHEEARAGDRPGTTGGRKPK